MNLWDEESDLYLVTPYQLSLVPDGTKMHCIDGSTVIKGKDYIDADTRGGYTAYGFIDPEKTLDKELLTILLLAKPVLRSESVLSPGISVTVIDN